MSEFNNRMAAQRDILVCVNRHAWREELFGLSSLAIERWTRVNGLSPESLVVRLITQAAEKLFLLANKSQEQITDEYRLRSGEVASLTSSIAAEMANVQ